MDIRWQKIQKILEERQNPGIFQVWIKPLQAVIHDSHITVQAPNTFVASWVQDRLKRDIQTAAEEILEKQVTLSVTISRANRPTPLVSAPSERKLELPLEYKNKPKTMTVWRFTFEDFIVGQCNELAYAACKSICRDIFPADNLFLCSGPGLGKTHLIQAIGHYLYKQKNELRVGYVTAEDFCNQMVVALKNREIDRFKSRYRESVDLLLLEDIHFFQGKVKMQEELLSTIKYLQSCGRKVVFTSSFLPRELSKVDSLLTSQFCSGFLAKIEKPDFDLRMKIIQHKADNLQVQIPGNVSEYVANSIQFDIRQLESCIKSMAIKAKLLRQSISLELARDILGNYATREKRPDLDRIVHFICDSFKLPEEKLKSKSKKHDIVMARNVAFYLARQHTELSLKDIGHRFNRRHSTVLKGISNVEREITRETSMGRQLKRVVQKLDQ